MPRTLRTGSTGPDVVDLQSRLNNAPPTKLPALAVDGVFGPKTRARVVEFQKSKGLDADGIVGPKTWAALMAIPGGLIIPDRLGIDCGNTDPANKKLLAQVAIAFGQGLAALGIIPPGAAFNPFGQGGFSLPPLPSLPSLPSLPAPPTFRKLTATEEATARGVFGNSLNFGTIFISDKSGAQNRPFTGAIPVPVIVATTFNVSGIVQVMNLGTKAAAPSTNLLIHELTHVWQSQHGTSKLTFMANSLACQGVAIAANLAEVANAVRNLDFAKANAIRTSPGFPEGFPFSAYAHVRGTAFNTYAAEQIANQVEHGVSTIVAHVAGVAAGAVDADNDKSLGNNTNVEDKRLATVTP